jgi:hypothetical protein
MFVTPTKIRPAMMPAATPRPRVHADNIQALSTLNLTQALAVAELLRREPDRLALRNALLVGYRARLPAGQSATRHAQLLADEIGDHTHPHAELFALIRGLGRGGGAPIAKVIERALLKTDEKRDASPAN